MNMKISDEQKESTCFILKDGKKFAKGPDWIVLPQIQKKNIMRYDTLFSPFPFSSVKKIYLNYLFLMLFILGE